MSITQYQADSLCTKYYDVVLGVCSKNFFFTKAEILKYFIVISGIVRPPTAKAW